MKRLIINTDGASRGNPGPAAAGVVIKEENGTVIFQGGFLLGKATNNEAEYLAVKLAFETLAEKFPADLPAIVEVRADSLLIVKQLCGEYKLKNHRLKALFDQVKCLEMELGRVIYTAIPREQNQQADTQANIALDANL